MRPRVASALLAIAFTGCGPPSVWSGHSPDHLTSYEVAARDGRACLRVEARAEQCFDGIAIPLIRFSSDSRRLAFPIEDGGVWYVVVDGERGPAVDGVGELEFSPDGSRFAYSALHQGSWHVAVDHELGEPFDSLFQGSLRFDPTGRRLAFAGARGARALAVADGRVLERHDGVVSMQFSPDGARLGYVARDGSHARLIVDGEVRATHAAISGFSFSWSGAEVAHAFLDDGMWWVSASADIWGPFSSVRALSYLGHASTPSFVAVSEGRERIIHDHAPGPWFTAVDEPVSDTLGARWGYIAHDSTKSIVMLDGTRSMEEEWATDLVFSPDGARFAYVALRAGLTYVAHDQGEQGFDVVVPGTLIFTDHDGRWACLVGSLDDQQLVLVVEGVGETRPFEWSEVGRLITISADQADLRGWVAAEVEILLGESGSR